MSSSKSFEGLLAYVWLWIWFVLVTAMSIWAYLQLVDIGVLLAVQLPTIAERLSPDEQSHIPLALLKFIAGVLFWWRIAKIVVILGSPFPFGLSLSNGRENKGLSGRPVHFSQIGSFGERIWFGSVLRSHPSSDKLVRCRLEFLILQLPFKLAFVIEESRFFLRLGYDSALMHRHYLVRAEQYMKKSTRPASDNLLRDVVARLDKISSRISRSSTRIDGLNWHTPNRGKWRVSDDFGHEVICSNLGGEGYSVTGLDSDDEEQIQVQSTDELRQLLKESLHPIPD